MGNKMINLGYAVLGKIKGYKERKFLVEGQEIKKDLAMEAFGEWFENNEKTFKRTYFLPESLGSDVEEIQVFFPKAKSVIIPSLSPINGYQTDATYEFVEFYMFINLLNDYLQLENSSKNFYCDISLGLNIYANALFEAFRRVYVFTQLMKFSEQETEKDKFYMFYTDPILGNEDTTITKIFTKQITVKAFFDIHIKRENFKEIEKNQILDKEDIDKFKDAYYMFQSIKLNAPLVVLTFGYPTDKEIKDLIKKIVNNNLEKLKQKIEKAKSDNTEKKRIYEPYDREYINFVYNILLSLALCYDVSKQLKNHDIKPEGQEKSKIEDIEKFLEIYDKYKLTANTIILERDIKSIKKGSLYENPLKRKNPKSAKERNFLAHSGFEYNITEYQNGFIFYSSEGKKIAKNLLVDNIKS